MGLRKLGRATNDRINLCRVLALPLPPPSGHFNARFPRWNFEFNVGVGVRVACPQLGSQLRTWWWIVTANTTPRCMGLHARLMNSRDESRCAGTIPETFHAPVTPVPFRRIDLNG